MQQAFCLAVFIATLAVPGVGRLNHRPVKQSRALVAGTVADPPLKRVHLISTGRQGSCALLKLVKSAGNGLPAVFEPLKGELEGAKILYSSLNELKRKQVRCLFSEDAEVCGRAGIINHGALKDFKKALAMPSHPPIVIKTTRIV